ncbi:MAG TPA: LysM peptidoglycan-binding domain-containing protein [Chitinophagaceae bacterium]|nr:LysM peptidoglycan-binding domain-containing protein [Chitinophagaceae bacterium]
MKKLFVVLLVSLAFIKMAIAQPNQLMIKGYGKDLYVDHKVSAKEGIFAIGRMYNVHPKFIASYNKLDMSKGLSIGQVLRIPLTDTNFSQKTGNGRPIYYKVGDKESMAKISSVNNKVPVQSLREWNKLKNDNVAAGTNLVVGFLVPGVNSVTAGTTPAKEEVKKPEENKAVAKKDTIADRSGALVKKDEIKKEEIKREEPKKPEPVVVKKEVTSDMSGQGYFKLSFDQQVKAVPISKTETVTSGIFKMANISQEAKYYLLADGVNSGTVVRVINPDNNKAIYAKVLGDMNSNRPEKGLNIRISDTAASELGITDTDKFIVKINY